jgi:peroxiredoxin
MPLPQVRVTMRCTLITLVFVMLASAGERAYGQADPGRAGDGLESRLASVQARQSKAVERYEQELRGAKSDEERAAAKSRYESEFRQDIGDILNLARSQPDNPAAVRALQFVVMSDSQGARGEADRAIELLTRDHVRRPRMGNYCGVLTNMFYSPAAEAFTRAVLERNPSHEARALACRSLATLLRQQARFARHLRTHPDEVKAYKADHGDEAIARFLREKDPVAMEREAEAALERVENEFGGVRPTPRSSKTLGEIAGGELNEMRHLNVGQTAPEIEGADVEGKRFKLSDFRGKVVLLIFSGEWCRPCVEMYPRERALQDRYRGKPFTVAGVNTDQSRETLKKSIDAGRVTWPCWWDGGTDGPVATRWGVSGYPSVYVIDARGIIRYRDLAGEAMEKAVIELMAKE